MHYLRTHAGQGHGRQAGQVEDTRKRHSQACPPTNYDTWLKLLVSAFSRTNFQLVQELNFILVHFVQNYAAFCPVWSLKARSAGEREGEGYVVL